MYKVEYDKFSFVVDRVPVTGTLVWQTRVLEMGLERLDSRQPVVQYWCRSNTGSPVIQKYEATHGTRGSNLIRRS